MARQEIDSWLGRMPVVVALKQVKPGDNARKVRTARADAHAAKLAPTIKKTTGEGRAIAAALNKRNIPTASGRGGEWHPAQVSRVLARL